MAAGLHATQEIPSVAALGTSLSPLGLWLGCCAPKDMLAETSEKKRSAATEARAMYELASS